jgi:hypothetical protein
MLSSIKTSALLFVLFIILVPGSIEGLFGQDQRNQNPGARRQRPIDQRLIDQQQKKQEELEGQYPVVDYDTPEVTSNSENKNARKIKNSRFDKRHFVSKDSATHIAESSRVIEGYNVPALPVDQSNLIILGEVLSSQAYISNDKSGVYTELQIKINDVIKNNASAQLAQGDEISAQREGGIVRYSNGHKRLYHLAEEGMPQAGRKYVLFLKQIEQSQDFLVITGYEVTTADVVPVDTSHQFRPYAGQDVDGFLKMIRAAINYPKQVPLNN